MCCDRVASTNQTADGRYSLETFCGWAGCPDGRVRADFKKVTIWISFSDELLIVAQTIPYWFITQSGRQAEGGQDMHLHGSAATESRPLNSPSCSRTLSWGCWGCWRPWPPWPRGNVMGGNTEGAPACENTLQQEYRDVVRIHSPIHKQLYKIWPYLRYVAQNKHWVFEQSSFFFWINAPLIFWGKMAGLHMEACLCRRLQNISNTSFCYKPRTGT